MPTINVTTHRACLVFFSGVIFKPYNYHIYTDHPLAAIKQTQEIFDMFTDSDWFTIQSESPFVISQFKKEEVYIFTDLENPENFSNPPIDPCSLTIGAITEMIYGIDQNLPLVKIPTQS